MPLAMVQRGRERSNAFAGGLAQTIGIGAFVATRRLPPLSADDGADIGGRKSRRRPRSRARTGRKRHRPCRGVAPYSGARDRDMRARRPPRGRTCNRSRWPTTRSRTIQRVGLLAVDLTSHGVVMSADSQPVEIGAGINRIDDAAIHRTRDPIVQRCAGGFVGLVGFVETLSESTDQALATGSAASTGKFPTTTSSPTATGSRTL